MLTPDANLAAAMAPTDGARSHLQEDATKFVVEHDVVEEVGYSSQG